MRPRNIIIALGLATALATCVAQVDASPTNIAVNASTPVPTNAAARGGTASNTAPHSVNVGAAADVTVNTNLSISCSASDDGLPSGTLTCAWTKQSGAGSCSFGNSNLCSTTVQCDASGAKAIRCTVSDSALTAFADKAVTINTGPTSVNAGSDASVAVNTNHSISCSASDDGNPNPPGALSYTWSKTAGTGTCSFGNANAASTTVQCNAATTFTIQCSASDGSLSAADTLALTVTAAGCSSGDPWPGYEAFCPADAAAQLSLSTGSGGTGLTVAAPTPPTLPNGAVTVYSGAAADTEAEVEAAMQGAGLSHIILGADISSPIDPHNAGVGATDVVLDLNGHVVTTFAFGFEAGNCARIVIMNGRVKEILGFGSSSGCSDVLWHGVTFGDTDSGTDTALVINSGIPCNRWSFVNTVAVGADNDTGGSIGLFGDCDDLTIINSNWEGGTGSTPNHDDWALRMGFTSERSWVVDSYMMSHYKPVLRTNGGELIVYSTDGCVDQPCGSNIVNTATGNLPRAVDDGSNGIDVEQFIIVRTDFVMGNTLGVSDGTQELWGPRTDTDFAFWGGNDFCTTSSAMLEEADLVAHEASEGGDSWDLNESYDGKGTEFTHNATIGNCVEAWPMRSAAEIDGFPVTGSGLGTIEDDPHDIGP